MIERYRNEVNRVNGVLEGVLKKNDGWLTGEKCTVADLSFVIWLDVIVRLLLERFLLWHESVGLILGRAIGAWLWVKDTN